MELKPVLVEEFESEGYRLTWHAVGLIVGIISEWSASSCEVDEYFYDTYDEARDKFQELKKRAER
jgi:hypothetical protein